MSTYPCTDSACAARAALRELKARLTCVLCRSLPEAPVALADCGHTFCSRCIREHLARRSRCPFPACPPADTRKLVPLRWLDFGEHGAGDGATGGGGEAAQAGGERPAHLAVMVDAGREWLKVELGKAGLKTTGDLDVLLWRHREHVMVHNVAVDSAMRAAGIPAFVRRRVAEAEAGREALARRRKVGRAERAMWGGRGVSSEYEREVGVKRKVMGGRDVDESDGEEKSGNGKQGDSFEVLIRKVKARKQKKCVEVVPDSVETDVAVGAEVLLEVPEPPDSPPGIIEKDCERGVVVDVDVDADIGVNVDVEAEADIILDVDADAEASGLCGEVDENVAADNVKRSLCLEQPSSSHLPLCPSMEASVPLEENPKKAGSEPRDESDDLQNADISHALPDRSYEVPDQRITSGGSVLETIRGNPTPTTLPCVTPTRVHPSPLEPIDTSVEKVSKQRTPEEIERNRQRAIAKQVSRRRDALRSQFQGGRVQPASVHPTP